MKNLYTSSLFIVFSLLVSISSLYASEAKRIDALLEQEKQSGRFVHCTNKIKKEVVDDGGVMSEEFIQCNRKKIVCENTMKHKERSYYCMRCDEQCSLCKEVCKKDGCNKEKGEELDRCWEHDFKVVRFCSSCGECPKCEDGESIKNDNLAFCAVCTDEKDEKDPDWVIFDSCDHYDKEEEAYAYSFCNSCVVNQCADGDGNCPICRVPIKYSKCDACRKYLSPDHEKAFFTCNTCSGDVKHNLHIDCFRVIGEHGYKNKGQEVFRCPLEHGKGVYSRNNFEVVHNAVQQVKADKSDLDENKKVSLITVSDKPKDCCEFCYEAIERENGFKFNCRCSEIKWDGKDHYVHRDCLQSFVDLRAIRIKGRIGINCPFGHHVASQEESNERMFVVLDNYMVGIKVPERFTVVCDICRDEVVDLNSAAITAIDCNRRIRPRLLIRRLIPFAYDYDNHRSYYHWKCLKSYIDDKKRTVSEGFLWLTKVAKIPCPYHAGTNKNHLVLLEFVRL